jgi:DNA-binding FrmR family transcriptional regulator
MSELTEPNRVSALENIIVTLEDRVEGLEGQLRALEKRLDHDDAIRDKLREIAALGDQRVGVNVPTVTT